MDWLEVEFALIAEAGPLEAQVLLLVESLRRFGGRYAGATVTVASPRPSRRPAGATIRALQKLGAEYLALDIAGDCAEYVTSWRVHTLAQLERRPGPPVLVQLDSDTLFLGDVGALCVETDVIARPVDTKGMGTTGPGDRFEPYWSELCRLAGVDLETLPFVTTTVDNATVRATHNGGFVAARRATGLFECADEVFCRSVDAGLRPYADSGLTVRAGTGEVGTDGSEWWGSAQAATSVAAASLGIEIGPLDDRVNVPVHLWDQLQVKPEPVVHAHYHHLLGSPLPQPNALLDGNVVLPGGAHAWLQARIPLGADPARRDGHEQVLIRG